jgi:manganese-dependent inorganic pyrophosphatase
MDHHNVRILPVLNADRRCVGLLSLFKLSKFLFPATNRLIDSRRVLSSLINLTKTLGGQILVGPDPRREEELFLTIGAMSFESFTKRLERYKRDKLAVVVGDRTNIQRHAIEEGVRVLIITGGLPVEPEIIKLAEAGRVGLISSPHDTVTTAALCRAAVAIRHMLNEEFLSLREDAPLTVVRAAALASGYAAFPVTDAAGRTVGILSKTNFLKPVDRKLILVDHNELSQAVQGRTRWRLWRSLITTGSGRSPPSSRFCFATSRWAPPARLWRTAFSATTWNCRRPLPACCWPGWFRTLST